MNREIEPIEPIPAIRDVHRAIQVIRRKYQTPEEREAEDLNDKKAVWYMAAIQCPRAKLTERERGFVDRYAKEGLRPSFGYNTKYDILQLYEKFKQDFKNR